MNQYNDTKCFGILFAIYCLRMRSRLLIKIKWIEKNLYNRLSLDRWLKVVPKLTIFLTEGG